MVWIKKYGSNYVINSIIHPLNVEGYNDILDGGKLSLLLFLKNDQGENPAGPSLLSCKIMRRVLCCVYSCLLYTSDAADE